MWSSVSRASILLWPFGNRCVCSEEEDDGVKCEEEELESEREEFVGANVNKEEE